MTIDVVVFTHRHAPDYLGPLYESIGRQTPVDGVRLQLALKPGSVHSNFARALDMCVTQRWVVCDEDVVFLTPNWLEKLMQDLDDNPDIGVVGTAQVKTEEGRFDYEAGLLVPEAKLERVKWMPGHVIAGDRMRTGTIRPDIKIPGVKGMSDVDYCLAIRNAGLEIAIDHSVVVYHPDKAFADSARREMANPTIGEEQEIFPKQVAFMLKKWGTMYQELCPTSWRADMLPKIREECAAIGVECPW